MTAEGTGAHMLAESLDVSGVPSWAPDGEWIVVTAEKEQEPRLFKVPVQGGTPIQLVHELAWNPVWSPDGRLIVYSGPQIGVTALSAIPDGPAKDNGIKVGEIAADIILALRANDGWNAVVPYTPGTRPGDWQPTPPAFAPALLPGWGQVTTFGIKNGAQFRSSPPPAIHTGRYARDYNEVKEVGEVTSTERPQDRTDVARFYASPPVQLFNPAARQVSAAQGKTLSENARIFALLGMAICDGLISSMETKFFYNYWRPVTAIRAGDTDGNRKTDPDPAWLPLIVTPAFPSYPSNHASGSGAAGTVLEHLYGESGHSITLTSPTAPGVVLNYSAWEQITDDIDDARVYGGIHFRFDQDAGNRLGRRVGSYILRNHLRPIHEHDKDHGANH